MGQSNSRVARKSTKRKKERYAYDGARSPEAPSTAEEYIHDPEREILSLCAVAKQVSSGKEFWATADADGNLRFCSMAPNGDIRLVSKRNLYPDKQTHILNVTYAEQPGLVACAAQDSSVHLYCLSSESEGQASSDPNLDISEDAVAVLRPDSGMPYVAMASPPASICGSGQSLLLTGARNTVIDLWDLTKETQLATCRRSRNVVTHMSWNPTDINTFFQTAEDRHLRMWDTRTMEVELEFACCDHIVSDSDCHTDGIHVMTTQLIEPGSNKPQVMIWDIRKTSEPVKSFKDFCTTRFRSSFIPDSNDHSRKTKRAVTIGDGVAYAFDALSSEQSSQQALGIPVTGRTKAMAWSYYSQIVCCAGRSGGVAALRWSPGSSPPLLGMVTAF